MAELENEGWELASDFTNSQDNDIKKKNTEKSGSESRTGYTPFLKSESSSTSQTDGWEQTLSEEQKKNIIPVKEEKPVVRKQKDLSEFLPKLPTAAPSTTAVQVDVKEVSKDRDLKIKTALNDVTVRIADDSPNVMRQKALEEDLLNSKGMIESLTTQFQQEQDPLVKQQIATDLNQLVIDYNSKLPEFEKVTNSVIDDYTLYSTLNKGYEALKKLPELKKDLEAYKRLENNPLDKFAYGLYNTAVPGLIKTTGSLINLIGDQAVNFTGTDVNKMANEAFGNEKQKFTDNIDSALRDLAKDMEAYTPEEIKQSFAYNLGSGVGSTMEIMGASLLGGPAAGVAAGFGMSFDSVKDEAIKSGYTEKEANNIATLISIPVALLDQVSVVPLLERLGGKKISEAIFRKVTSKLAGKTITNEILTKEIGNSLSEVLFDKSKDLVVKQMLPEGLAEFAQSGIESSGKAITDFITDKEEDQGFNVKFGESLSQALTEGGMGALSTGVIGGPTTVYQGVSELVSDNKSVYDEMKKLATDDDYFNRFQKQLEVEVKLGKKTQEDADNILDNIKAVAEIESKLPNTITSEGKRIQAIGLIKQKQELQSKLESTADDFKPAIEAKIKDVQSTLNKIATGQALTDEDVLSSEYSVQKNKEGLPVFYKTFEGDTYEVTRDIFEKELNQKNKLLKEVSKNQIERQVYDEQIGEATSIKRQPIQEVVTEEKIADGAVQAQEPTPSSQEKINDDSTLIAKRIRDKKIGGKGQLYSSIDFGLTQVIYDGALEFCAKQVEAGNSIGKAIENTIKWIDEKSVNKSWNKKDFENHLNSNFNFSIDGSNLYIAGINVTPILEYSGITQSDIIRMLKLMENSTLSPMDRKTSYVRKNMIDTIDQKIDFWKRQLDKEKSKIINRDGDISEFRVKTIEKYQDRVDNLKKLRDIIDQNLFSTTDVKIKTLEDKRKEAQKELDDALVALRKAASGLGTFGQFQALPEFINTVKAFINVIKADVKIKALNTNEAIGRAIKMIRDAFPEQTKDATDQDIQIAFEKVQKGVKAAEKKELKTGLRKLISKSTVSVTEEGEKYKNTAKKLERSMDRMKIALASDPLNKRIDRLKKAKESLQEKIKKNKEAYKEKIKTIKDNAELDRLIAKEKLANQKYELEMKRLIERESAFKKLEAQKAKMNEKLYESEMKRLIAEDVADKKKELRKQVKEMLKDKVFAKHINNSNATATALINKVNSINTQKQLDNFIDYLDKLAEDGKYNEKISNATSNKNKIDRLLTKDLKKKIPFDLFDLLKELSRINPSKLSNQDLEEYLRITDSIKDGIFPKVKDGKIFLGGVNQQEIQDFVEPLRKDESSSVFKNPLLDEVNRLTSKYGNQTFNINGKKYNGFIELGLAQVSGEITTDEYISAVESVIKQVSDELKRISLNNRYDLQDYLRINSGSLSDAELNILKDLTNADVNLLSDGELMQYINTSQQILENNNFNGAKVIADISNGSSKIKEVAAIAPQVRKTVWGRGYVSNFFSLPMMYEAMTKSLDASTKLMKALNVNNIISKSAEAKTKHQKFIHDVNDIIDKWRKKGIDLDSPESNYMMGVISNVFQFKNPESNVLERNQEYRERLLDVREDIRKHREATLGGGVKGEENKAKADLLEKALNDLGITPEMGYQEAEQIIKDSFPGEYEVVSKSKQVFSDNLQMFKDNTEIGNNKQFKEVYNYGPTIVRSTGNSESEISEIDKIKFDRTDVSRKQVGSSFARTGKGPESVYDYNFLNTSSKVLLEQLLDSHVQRETIITQKILNSKEVKDLLGNDNVDMIKKALVNKLNDDYRTSPIDKSVSNFIVKKILTLNNRYVRVMLGSANQVFKQYAGVVADAAIGEKIGRNVMKSWGLNYKKDSDVRNLLEKFPIGERIRENPLFNTNAQTEDLERAVLDNRNKIIKATSKVLKSENEANKAWGEIILTSLKTADNYAAMNTWVAAYAKKLEELTGAKFDDINWANESQSPNQEAADYAEQVVSRTQYVSDISLGSAALKSKTSADALVKNLLFPLATFTINNKNRILVDLANIKTDPNAMRRVVAYGIGIGLYNILVASLKELGQDAADSIARMFGFIPEDDKKKMSDFFKDVAKEFALEATIGGIAITDDLAKLIVNTIYDMTTADEIARKEEDISDNKILHDKGKLTDAEYKSEMEDDKEALKKLKEKPFKIFSKEYGRGNVTVALDALSKAIESPETEGTELDPGRVKKYERAFNTLMILDIAASLGWSEGTIYSMSRRVKKSIKSSLEKEKKEAKEEANILNNSK